jgi:hypothetical protein
MMISSNISLLKKTDVSSIKIAQMIGGRSRPLRFYFWLCCLLIVIQCTSARSFLEQFLLLSWIIIVHSSSDVRRCESEIFLEFFSDVCCCVLKADEVSSHALHIIEGKPLSSVSVESAMTMHRGEQFHVVIVSTTCELRAKVSTWFSFSFYYLIDYRSRVSKAVEKTKSQGYSKSLIYLKKLFFDDSASFCFSIRNCFARESFFPADKELRWGGINHRWDLTGVCGEVFERKLVVLTEKLNEIMT